jgi:hypothetical protein
MVRVFDHEDHVEVCRLYEEVADGDGIEELSCCTEGAKRTLPWGWYFMGLDMKEGSEVKRVSCVSDPTVRGKSSPATGEK